MAAAASSNLKKVTLELGGKSAHLVFKSANLKEGPFLFLVYVSLVKVLQVLCSHAIVATARSTREALRGSAGSFNPLGATFCSVFHR